MTMPDEIQREFKQEALDAVRRIAERDAKDIKKEPKIFSGFLGLAEGRNTFYDMNKLSNDRGLGLSTTDIEKIINNSYEELELPNKFDALTLPKKYTKQMQDNRDNRKEGGLLSDDREKFNKGDKAESKILKVLSTPFNAISDFGYASEEARRNLSRQVKNNQIEKINRDIDLNKRILPVLKGTKTLDELKTEFQNLFDSDFIKDDKVYQQSIINLFKDTKRNLPAYQKEIAETNKMPKKVIKYFNDVDVFIKKYGKNILGDNYTRPDLTLSSSRDKKQNGGLLNPEKADLDNDGELSSYEEARGEAIEENMREQKQVGGMMMDDQMADMMEEEENKMPMDNQMSDMMPEEKTEEQKAIEEAQAPDEKMEDNYVDFLIDEALSDEEEGMLMQELQANPQLSMLFDKVMEVAMEFSGSGPVEGPGSEVSDSIPARLSDGEFVFTAKAVDVIGVDNLMSMMKQAEAQAEERQMAQDGGLMEEENVMPVEQQPVEQNIRVTKETVGSQAAMQEEEDLVGDELKKSMLSTRPYVRS